MQNLARRTLLVVLCFRFFGIAAASEALDFKGQLSFNYIGSDTSPKWQNQAILRYMPDVTILNTLSDGYSWDINASADISADYQSQPESTYSSDASFYRLNARLKTPQSDTQLGLQQINFGPAIILRSLRWFDQVRPTDPLQLSEGVKGLRYRYFFSNNANLWLWTLYGNNDPKGYETVATKHGTPEAGGRFQYPLESGELGFSFHVRTSERLGFSGTSIGEDVHERRLALDGKWDLGPGIWYEYVLVDQGAGAKVKNNWLNMLTLGADYTFAIGNGVHVLGEHLVSAFSDKAMQWEQRTQASALQLSYPVGILDAVSLLTVYSWTQEQPFHYLRWDRTYDNWVLSLGMFHSPKQATLNSDLAPTGFSGNGIQAVIVFNH